jgi:hypothetical protein
VKDPVEIQRRIERLVKRVRRRDDDGKLLARGDVVRSVDDIDDPETWRAEIKRQAPRRSHQGAHRPEREDGLGSNPWAYS